MLLSEIKNVSKNDKPKMNPRQVSGTRSDIQIKIIGPTWAGDLFHPR